MLENAFAQHAGADMRIDAAELQKALGLRSEYLAQRVLQCLDRDGNGVLTRDEFLAGVRTLVFGSDRDKLYFAFRVHDHNGDGYIDRQELHRMIAISMAEAEILDRSSTPESLTNAVFARADLNGDGRISFDELETIVRQRPALLDKMTRHEAIWIAPNEDLLDMIEERDRKKTARGPARDDWVAPFVFVTLWVLANVALFAFIFVTGNHAKHPNLFLRIGRALGFCIQLDGALILIPVMRRLMTWVRSSSLKRVFAVDAAIDFHRLVGHTIVGLGVAHACVSILAYAFGHGPHSLAALFLTVRGATGAVLVLVIVVMWLGALSFIRRTHRFELFYATHLLYFVWLGVAIAHAPTVAFWFGVPILGLLIERALRLRRRSRPSPVVAIEAHRSGVTRLEIARPKGFDFDPGDFAFLRIPSVAKREWHPFTVSSGPERPNLTFHVRSLGNWTGALRELAESHPSELTAQVDGPYGSPSRHIFESRYAVLIGAGIGVTPFASVLESIVLRHNSLRTGAKAKSFNLRKAHFFWLNRDQYSFEWFSALLRDLERTDQDGLLDIHLCMTGGRAGVTSLGLELARDITHAEGHSDIVTGLRSHTHLGPPDWQALLGAVRDAHAGEQVDIFYCGPPGLAKKIKRVAEHLGMSFREERF